MLNYLRNRYNKRKEKKKKSLKRKIILTITIVVVVLVVVVMYFSDDDMLNYQIKKSQTASSNNIYEEQEGVTRTVYYTQSAKSGSGKGKGKGANGSIDASTEEILNAINQIIGNLDDAWIKGDTPMLENQIAYIKKALPMMICMHLKFPDIYTSTGLIQNTQESGWNGEPSVPGSNNFFGIKDGGRAQTEYWHGDVVNRWAVEGGMANFCAYPDVQTSVMDYGAFLKTNSRYGNAGVFSATGSVEQITRIMNAGYAPGSESMYIAHAESLMGRLKFGRFDELADQVAQALGSGSGNYDDEWNPSGGSLDKIVEAGVDLASISDKRKKVLAEGEALLGTPYRQVRPYVLPNKNDDGTYDVATGLMDCSAFTSHCVMEALGIDIGGNTFAQMANSNLEAISTEEAQAGDLYFPHSGHVTFLLAKNGDGTLKVIHEPGSGQVCKIGNYNLTSGHRFYRVKGIDD